MAETAAPADNPNPDAWHEAEEPQRVIPERSSAAFEGTELARLRQHYSRASSYRPNTLTPKPSNTIGRLQYAVSQYWRHQISITVEHATCRDHLAVERTFLSYLRTSLAFSMIGISIAQLFRLQVSPNPSPTFGFYVLGKPLACIMQACAILILLAGAFRTWRSQNAIVRGKAISGGFEMVTIAVCVFLVLLAFFVLLVAVDIEKEDL